MYPILYFSSASFGDLILISLLLSKICPELILSSPSTHFINSVLPAPTKPYNPSISPFFKFKLIFL